MSDNYLREEIRSEEQVRYDALLLAIDFAPGENADNMLIIAQKFAIFISVKPADRTKPTVLHS